MSLPRCWINGEENDRISAYDRGLSYGDGFFSTMLVQSGQLMNWSSHYQRIEESCRRLGFAALSEARCLEELSATFACLSQEQKQQALVAKIIFTRGEGGRGYQPPPTMHGSLIIQWSPAPTADTAALQLHLCQTSAGSNRSLAGMKHLNRLENVLARHELMRNDWQEGVMCTDSGEVVSATQANLYLISAQKVTTPRLDLSGVAGTVRNALPEMLASHGWQWEERNMQLRDLLSAEEVFLSNAVRGIMPVSAFVASRDEVKSYACEKGAWLAAAWQQYQTDLSVNLNR
ncbi:aminodeoxychorismate lyase [Thiomicrorhabdus xiamenensis]|uniref:Aminodeoxychorismate lyase n=1 Tax=Thiomicrorhabdus xiamenensis TaxID=2739063 RepID=A0A7D4TDW3_9GAMM|nr:aminodeoxychorismate lyase [Thiomicrorhabdus xiamenensis]QKI88927.1 aminodeoxychorismate lyase [Thiomicrorhabdus xiamenensis]